jgi:hemoglobin-like flavoprotein
MVTGFFACNAATMVEAGTQQMNVAAVLSSYARCRERGGFVENFYRQLWARDPGIARRFEKTDMERQQDIMREAINTLLMFARDSAVARMALDRIAKVHDRGHHDVPPSLYRLFAEVLVATAASWDPRWTPTLEQQWQAALKPGLDYMANRY